MQRSINKLTDETQEDSRVEQNKVVQSSNSSNHSFFVKCIYLDSPWQWGNNQLILMHQVVLT